MPIRLPPTPPEAHEALHDPLSSLLGQPESGRHIRAMAEAAPVGVSGLHPVYAGSAQDIVDGRLLASAQLAGWRAIVSKDGEPLAAAEVTSAMQLAYVNEGPFVAGTAEAVMVAEARFAGDARDYEWGLLRVPAGYTIALWLHAEDTDVFIPVAPAPAPLRANEAMEEGAFADALRPAAEAALRGPEVT